MPENPKFSVTICYRVLNTGLKFKGGDYNKGAVTLDGSNNTMRIEVYFQEALFHRPLYVCMY